MATGSGAARQASAGFRMKTRTPAFAGVLGPVLQIEPDPDALAAAASTPAAVMPITAAYAPPDTPSVAASLTMMVAPPMSSVIVGQFDVRLAAFVGHIRRRGVQFVENAARVGHSRDGVDRADGRRHRCGAGKAQNSGEECSSIHRNLQS
jgi:hypothetical protein